MKAKLTRIKNKLNVKSTEKPFTSNVSEADNETETTDTEIQDS